MEIQEEKQTLAVEEQTIKAIPNPQAAAIVMQDEEKLKEKVKAKEIGKEVKEEVKKVAERKVLVTKMKLVTAETKVKAKVSLFNSELKATKRLEKGVGKQEIYEVKLALYNAGVKAASKDQAVPDAAKATVPEQVKAAELKKLEEEIKRCAPCAVPPPPLPKICAAKEGAMCECKGTVYYGKKFTSGKPGSGAITTLDELKATPFKEKAVTGSISCSNGAFGDPVPGFYKHCVCVS